MFPVEGAAGLRVLVMCVRGFRGARWVSASA